MNHHPDPVLFLAVTPSMRTRIEATIEHLLALLDTIDGDPDLEDGDDAEGDDAEPEETDQDGDEGDFCRSEDDALIADLYGFVPGRIMGGQGL